MSLTNIRSASLKDKLIALENEKKAVDGELGAVRKAVRRVAKVLKRAGKN